jgi:hypothetical protein
MLPQVGERGIARTSLAVGGDRVLQIEDQGVGARAETLGKLLLAVGGQEQE